LGDVHRFGLPRKNICGIKRDTEHEKAERYTWASRTGGNQKLSEFGHSSWGKRWIWGSDGFGKPPVRCAKVYQESWVHPKIWDMT